MAPAYPNIISPNFVVMSLGVPASFIVVATGTPAPTISLSLVSGALPPGLTLTNGVISGTPIFRGLYTVQLQAYNGVSPTALQSFRISVDSAIFTSKSQTGFPLQQVNTFTITTGGNPTPVISLSPKSFMPAGITLTLNNDGTATLSGTAVTNGTYSFQLIATNTYGTDKQGFSLIVPTHLPAILTANYLTVAASTTDNVNQNIATARGLQSSMVFTATVPTGKTGFPGNFAMDTTGNLTGHYNTPGTYTVLINCDNRQGHDQQDFYLVVVGAGSGPNGEMAYPNPAFSANGLPAGVNTISAAYASNPPVWDGGGNTYIVPAGISYQNITPTPDSPITIQNATFYLPFSNVSINDTNQEITVKPVQQITSANNVTFINVNSYGSNGGNPVYHGGSWTNQAGWALKSANNITYTNCFAYNTTGDGMSVQGDYTNPNPGAGGPCQNLSINGFTAANNGRQSFTFSYCANSPNLNNMISLNPAEPATMDMEADAGGPQGGVGCSNITFNNLVGSHLIRIIEDLQGPVTFNGGSFNGVNVYGSAASSGQKVTLNNCQIQVNRTYGGIPPAGIWVRGAGNLILNNCTVTYRPGVLSPTAPWIAEANPGLTDGGSITFNNCLLPNIAGTHDAYSTVTINSGTSPTFTTPNAISVVQNTSMAVFLFGLTGTPYPTLSITSGSLPAGIGLLQYYGYFLTGTPTVTGTFPITLTATNTAGSITQNFTLTVVAPTSLPVFTTPNTGTLNQSVSGSFPITAVGNPAPDITMVGNLPAGTYFLFGQGGYGAIGGTPTQVGTFPVTLTATNTIGFTNQNMVITVNATTSVAPSFTSLNTVTFNQNVPSTFSVSAVGTPTPVISLSGTPPAGISLVNNTLAGIPTVFGTYPLTLTAVNSAGTTNQSFSLVILPATNTPIFTSSNKLNIAQNNPVSFTINVLANPTAAIAMSGTLPAGMTFGSGVLSGTPRTSGAFPLTFIATNFLGTTTQSFILTVVDRKDSLTNQHWGVF